MKKRIISLILTFNFLFLFLCGRLFQLSSAPQTVSLQSSLRVKEINVSRGMIYDRNMKPLVNTEYTYTFLIKPSAYTINLLKERKYDENTIEKLKNGNLVLIESKNNREFNENNYIKSLPVFERYPDNCALHIIGYTDYENNGVNGIEKYYNDTLTKSGGTLSIAYSADAKNRLLMGEDVEIRNTAYYDGDGIVLTIDKDIQKFAENALKNNNIKKGAVIVLDTQTGGILACASVPCYDRNNLEDYIKSEDAPFLNRGFCAYPVGSVFKLVTAVSAIENNISLPSYTCTGKIEKSNNIFNCNKTEGHGIVDITQAIAQSCNPYFIELGTKTGAKNLLNTAEASGFGKSTDLGNGNFTDSGILPENNDLNSDAAIGNFAFGQGKFTATPLQVAVFLNTVANDGIYKEPYLIKGSVNSNGAFSPDNNTSEYRIFKESTCKILKDAMLNTTNDGTGKIAFSSLFNSCTKTATAQSGQYDKDGNEIKICWFTGFFPAENPKYTVCVIKEDGIAGGSDCGPVFKEISENIYIKSKTPS